MEVPRYSLAERDRRWALSRQITAAENVKAVIAHGGPECAGIPPPLQQAMVTRCTFPGQGPVRSPGSACGLSATGIRQSLAACEPGLGGAGPSESRCRITRFWMAARPAPCHATTGRR